MEWTTFINIYLHVIFYIFMFLLIHTAFIFMKYILKYLIKITIVDMIKIVANNPWK